MTLPLVEFLASKLPEIERAEWEDRLSFGGAYVNRRPVLNDTPIPPDAQVEYFEPCFEFSKRSEVYPVIDTRHVLFRDDDLAIVVKPPGLPSVFPREQRTFSFDSALGKLFGRTVHLPSRLDSPVGGVVLISLSSRANGSLQRAFEEHRIEKRYRFECAPAAAWKERSIEAPIGRDPERPSFHAIRGDGKPARTEFRVIEDRTTSSLVEAHPLTGRTHQIRLHAAHAGSPIIGDYLYGGAPSSELRLSSYGIALVHPYRSERLEVTLPADLRPAWLG